MWLHDLFCRILLSFFGSVRDEVEKFRRWDAEQRERWPASEGARRMAAREGGEFFMKEETIHYLVRFLKRNPSEDPRHGEAMKELADVQNVLLDNYRETVLLSVEQPRMVHLMLQKALKEGQKAVSK